MSSILTNNSAIVTLQTLKGINQSLAKTQDAISTGKTINSAKDNAAIWAISKVMDSDVNAFKAIQSNLSMGASVIGNARVAAETVGTLLSEIKNKVVAAQDGSFNRTTLQADINDLKAQITSAVGASQFNGINLVNGTEIVDFKVLASIDRATGGVMTPSTIDVDPTAADLTLAGTILTAMDTIDVVASTDLAADLQTVEDAISDVIDVAFAFGSAGKRIEIQSNFISKLSDSMTTAVGALVDTNMEEASARLQALQTQQQLGIQSLSIANQGPSSILALFRN